MATSVNSLLCTALRCQYRVAVINARPRLVAQAAGGRRYISATARRWDDPKGEVKDAKTTTATSEDGAKEGQKETAGQDKYTARQLAQLEKRLKEQLSGSDLAMLAPDNDDLSDAVARINSTIRSIAAELGGKVRMPPTLRNQPGLLSEGVEKGEEMLPDPEFEEDDISALAHGELDQHRDYRHYARIAAWEMPMLSKLAKPFKPPTKDQVLRFRYTTYLGEQHPAENKVVLEFCPEDLPDLTKAQLQKLIKLLGVRYNPETKIAKMSCEMFESQAQNKRYLGDLVDTLLREARDPTDTFEDVPYDRRHYDCKAKTKPKFPVEWRLTDDRRAQLELIRQQSLLRDQQYAAEGKLIDGIQRIEAGNHAAAAAKTTAIPEPVLVGRGSARKSKLTVRR